MDLDKDERGRFRLTLSEVELRVVQAGLRETLDLLPEWEFRTRTGGNRQDFRALLDQIVAGQSDRAQVREQ